MSYKPGDIVEGTLKNKGTSVGSAIRPNSYNDNIASVYASDIRGGHQTCDLLINGNPLDSSTSYITYQDNNVTPTIIATVLSNSCSSIFFDYVISSGTTNMRAGTIIAIHDGNDIDYAEMKTNDIGDTSTVVLSCDIFFNSDIFFKFVYD
jgi:hypothetical protein